MSETSETVFSVTLGENNTPKVKVDVDPRVSCIDDSDPFVAYPWLGHCLSHLGVPLAIAAIVLLVLGAVIPIIGAQETTLRFARAGKQAFISNPWPFVAIISVILTAIVVLFWIMCRHVLRMEKIAAEERKQRFDMRRFLVEKSIEFARQKTMLNKNAYPMFLTITKDAKSERNTNETSDTPHSPHSCNDDLSQTTPVCHQIGDWYGCPDEWFLDEESLGQISGMSMTNQ